MLRVKGVIVSLTKLGFCDILAYYMDRGWSSFCFLSIQEKEGVS